MGSELTRRCRQQPPRRSVWTGVGNVIVAVAFRHQSPVAVPELGR